MKFSQSVDLALHALWYMAKHRQNDPVMIKDIAIKLRASESYLARVMLRLSKAGLLKSIRGKKGGFVFKKKPSEITIADVISAIDTDTAEFTCSWEERGCDAPNGCVLVDLFGKAREAMLAVLRTMTIAQMVEEGEQCSRKPQWLTPIEPLVCGHPSAESFPIQKVGT